MACRERGAGIFILLIGGGVFCLRGRIGYKVSHIILDHL